MAVLSVRGVTKRYGRLTAVDEVSFEAQPGRILGFLGPNGAGKTSTIRMIAHILLPDEGEVLYGGRPVGPRSQRQMGYLPEERGLYQKMKVWDQLCYLAALKGLSRARVKEQVTHWAERFGLEDRLQSKTRALSKGMQQKMQFVVTILGAPSLLILDEPFGGLDPINSELLRGIIEELKDEGCTILFASHRMEQVEQLCDDICLIARGRVLINGALRDIKKSYGRDTLHLGFDGDGAFLRPFERAGRIEVKSRSAEGMVLKLNDDKVPRTILETIMSQGVSFYRFELAEPTLNEIFIREVEGS